MRYNSGLVTLRHVAEPAELLRNARENAGLRQEDLAAKLWPNANPKDKRTEVSKWESGKTIPAWAADRLREELPELRNAELRPPRASKRDLQEEHEELDGRLRGVEAAQAELLARVEALDAADSELLSELRDLAAAVARLRRAVNGQ